MPHRKTNTIRVLLALALILMLFMPGMPPLADTVPQAPATESTDAAVKANVLEAYGKLPILFVHNQGQLDESVEYYAKASGQTLYFTHENIVFDLIRYEEAQAVDLADRKAERMVFSLDFLGTNESPVIEGRNKDEAIVNYFIGNDPEKWHTDIPTYREVVYSDIYPDVDLRLYGRGGVLEYEFVVNPGSRVSDIELAYTGIDSLSIEDGELVAGTAFGDIKQTQPYIYQRIGDQVVEVDGGFRLAGGNAYGFQVAAYDTGYPVIIDPTLGYSTFLGGAGADVGCSIAVDASGCAYVTGETGSVDFPTTLGSYNGTYGGNDDAFVTKFNAAGNTLVYSTYLGGGGTDYGFGIAVDASGCAYVTGETESVDFPMQNSYNSTWGGNWDAFVTKFNAAGNTLAYSTYLGGGGNDAGFGIAVDAANCAYVTGETESVDFPTTLGSYNGTWSGNTDAFVTKFNAAGNTLAYSTYLGGSGGGDWGFGIAVDAANCAYVTGYTESVDFPMQNPYQGTYSGNVDAFVTKLGDPDITVTPTSLDFGSVAVGSSRPAQTVTVRNHGCSSLTIGTITLGGTNAGEFATQNDNCSGQSLAPGASATLQVVFNPTSAGAKTATLSIPSNDPDEDPFNVPLSGTGTQPNITVNPTSIDFGSVQVGSSSAPTTVTVTNDGTANLNVGTISLGGVNADQFAIQNDNCSGQTLAPGGSATVQVVFSPTLAGAKTATMAIPSDDRDEATVNVALSGTGTPAAPAPGPRASPTMHTPAPLPADIALQYLAVNPQQTYAGQPVTITTNVSNTGGSTGQYTVTLIINGQVEETRLVSVGAQSALPVKFTVTRDVPGTYTVTIGSQQASFVILGSGGGSAGLPASGGLVAILIMGVLVLITAVGLMLVLRRRAW